MLTSLEPLNMPRLRTIALLAGVVMLSTSARAGELLEGFLADIPPAELFPGADRIGERQRNIPVAPVFKQGNKVGYVFLNSDFVNATGYSGKPIHILVALDTNAVIVGTKLVQHHEPIVLIGIPERKITAALEGYVGANIAELARDGVEDRTVDIVSGATVTIMVMDDTVLHSAMRVARTLGLGGLTPEPDTQGRVAAKIDMERSAVEPWATLMDDGSVRRLRLTVDDVNQAFERAGDPLAADRPEPGAPGDVFIDLYTALVSVPTIGLSLLGEGEYRNLKERLAPGQHAILVAGTGRYSFKGSGYVRGGIFDRFQIIQQDNSVRFRDRDHKRLRRIEAAGAPRLKDTGVFVVPEDVEFDGTRSWRLELLVGRATGPTKKAFLTFDLAYEVPQKYLAAVDPPPAGSASRAAATSVPQAGPPLREPLWRKLWKQKLWMIVVVSAALAFLTWIFFFQNWLVKRPRLTEYVRLGFLTFTLFVLGWYANAQLSVVNILTVFNALVSGFNWEYFLMEPLIFILWGAVAGALLFWGRGAFCGWLCPFGALQELLNRIAKAVRIPQVSVPWWLHERLWALKYVIFLALFGVSLHSLSWAERLAEVEPFKTAIILKFAREWPFVVFALGTLAIGLFIERFYCRYLCPLGAALAIPGRMRMFEWLKRYKECGTPCQKCARECMVQAIHKEGNINPNECLYCLHCQTVYFDEQHCYVLIQRRLKRDRRTTGSKKPSLTDVITDIQKMAS